MKRTTFKIPYLFVLFIIISFFSCKYYVHHGFRQMYSSDNEILDRANAESHYLKIHLKDGNVTVLDKWELNPTQDSLFGIGKFYNFNRQLTSEGEVNLLVDDIAIIETNSLSVVASRDQDRITALSVLAGANAIGNFICLTNPKACFGSCPTFYLDGETYLHSSSAEGFSSSIAPSLEKRDVDALLHNTSSPTFSITMKNEALETHMINDLSIHAIPKKKEENVYHDKDGNYFVCGKTRSFQKVIASQPNAKEVLQSLDDFEYFSPTDSLDLTTKESLVFDFNPNQYDDLGVVINFRQTLLTTFLLYSGLSYMGDEAGDYLAKLETNKRMQKRFKSPFGRLGGIKFYVWIDKNKKWKYIDEIHETGPIAKNLMVVPLSKLNLSNQPVKIKIELAKGHWRLDYLGLTPIHKKVPPSIISPNKVDVIDGKNYTYEKVNKDDKEYLISMPGNEFKFHFDLPQTEEDQVNELFLSTKGYYLEWMRNEWLADKNIPKLKKMMRYDKATWRDLAREFKTMEHEMETVFWNSKYSKTQ